MPTDDIGKEALELHERLRGKVKIVGKMEVKDKNDLSRVYTPGVAEVCKAIAKDKSLAYKYTMKANTVAIVTDGTRILGLGDIGPEAGLPVMEGKAMIMNQFGGINAVPICLATKDENEIVRAVQMLAPSFGAINLEDIETPKVFRIQKRLVESMDIPVFHDDREGTAIVALAGLINAIRVLGLTRSAKVGVIGAGSAGYGITKLLVDYGFTNVTCFDKEGAIYRGRPNLEEHKQELAEITNWGLFKGKIDGFEHASVIIAASSPTSLPEKTILMMSKPNVIFALSNPVPELSEMRAKELGVDIYGSGRSDAKNQINNSICFPGFLRAVLELSIRKITPKMHIAAAEALANSVENPAKDHIIPETFDPNVAENIKHGIEKAMGAHS